MSKRKVYSCKSFKNLQLQFRRKNYKNENFSLWNPKIFTHAKPNSPRKKCANSNTKYCGFFSTENSQLKNINILKFLNFENHDKKLCGYCKKNKQKNRQLCILFSLFSFFWRQKTKQKTLNQKPSRSRRASSFKLMWTKYSRFWKKKNVRKNVWTWGGGKTTINFEQ